MNAAVPIFLVFAAAGLAASAYGLGYSTGQLMGMLTALHMLDQVETGLPKSARPGGPLHFTAPIGATAEEAFAWNADADERGSEYADGQLAFRRARDRAPEGQG